MYIYFQMLNTERHCDTHNQTQFKFLIYTWTKQMYNRVNETVGMETSKREQLLLQYGQIKCGMRKWCQGTNSIRTLYYARTSCTIMKYLYIVILNDSQKVWKCRKWLYDCFNEAYASLIYKWKKLWHVKQVQYNARLMRKKRRRKACPGVLCELVLRQHCFTLLHDFPVWCSTIWTINLPSLHC